MRSFLFISIVICVFSSGAISAGENDIEYMAVLMDGKKIGYGEFTRKVEGDKVSTTEDMSLTISRGAVSITVKVTQTSIETVAGKPLGFSMVQDLGGMAQSTVGNIKDDGTMEVTNIMMGIERKETTRYPEGALMGEGLRLFQIEKGMKEGEKFSVKVFDPSLLAAMNIDIEVGGKKSIDLFGRVVELTEVRSTMKMMGSPIETVSYVDEEFSPLKMTMPLMGMQLEFLACDKQFATSPNDVVDFVGGMLVQSPKVIENVKSKQKIRYTLATKEGKKITLPTDDNQKVDFRDDGKVVVTVEPLRAAGGEKFPYKGKDEKLLAMLKPTKYLQSDDRLVIELAKKAVAGAKDTAQAVAKIEAFVGEYIDDKDLSVGYASAAEVAVSRQGDCSEHAVLTAAMCRAVGIPARLATGVVYVDEFLGKQNVFGGHAWTQAWVNGKWIGLDATRAPNGYGVGHIMIATGSGEPADFLSMVNTLGYFTVEKIEE